jgi:hypothetical protein
MGIFSGNDPAKPNYIAPTYQKAELSDFQTAFDKFLKQEINFQELQDTIYSSADKYKSALDKLSPGYQAGLDKTAQIAASRAEGLLPADVAQKASRSAAYTGLSSGSGSNSSKALEARDLGLSSLQLQDSGVNMLTNLRNEAKSMMPLQAMNLAFSPQQIRSEDNTLAYYNNQITNRQAEANAEAYNRNQEAGFAYDSKYGGSGLGAMFGGLGGAGGGAAIGATLGSVVPGVGTAAGALLGAGIGMAAGGTIAGSYGGAKGQQMGSMFGGMGSAMAGFGGSMTTGGSGLMGGMGNQGFDYFSQAQQAAPYARGYSNTPDGWVPQAMPAQRFAAGGSGIAPRSGYQG